MSTPRAAIISRSDSPARMRMPRRVRAIRRWRPAAISSPTRMMASENERVVDAAGERNRPRQPRRHREIEGKRAEHPAGAFREHEDQREGREHLIQMVAAVEPPDDEDFDDRACGGRRREARRKPDPVRAGERCDRGAGERADHVERAVGEVDEAHDAEDQRQPGRHQEQHDAELQAVQQLFDDQRGGQILVAQSKERAAPGSPFHPFVRAKTRSRRYRRWHGSSWPRRRSCWCRCRLP